MKMTLNLAGTGITISFLGQAKKAMHLCNYFFRNFLGPEQKGNPKISIKIFKNTNSNLSFREVDENAGFERLLPKGEIEAFLNKFPETMEDFPIDEKTIYSSCPDGLLFFNPDTIAGRIYIFKQPIDCFNSLYKLLWIYFAQVLGEKGGCFVHATALAKNEEGYLLMGDSGAGKSTIARLCLECCVFSDDGPIFFRQNGEYRVYPSPFQQIDPINGLDKKIIRMNARVKGLYFLNKDSRVFLKNISKKMAFSMILKRHIHFFSYLSARAKSVLFDLFFDVCNNIPIYNLHFGKDQDVWKVIYGGNNGRRKR